MGFGMQEVATAVGTLMSEDLKCQQQPFSLSALFPKTKLSY